VKRILTLTVDDAGKGPAVSLSMDTGEMPAPHVGFLLGDVLRILTQEAQACMKSLSDESPEHALQFMAGLAAGAQCGDTDEVMRSLRIVPNTNDRAL
jgi:hypothetical protein